MENKKMNCSNCGAVIEDTYYKCLDNCLQLISLIQKKKIAFVLRSAFVNIWN